MANPQRGEIVAELDGRAHTLCLTLGALAELERALDAGDLMALAARFEAGRLTAREAIAIIAAGLRGAGHAVGDDEVAAMRASGGAAGYVRIVAELLEATFGTDDAGNGSAPAEAGNVSAPAEADNVSAPAEAGGANPPRRG